MAVPLSFHPKTTVSQWHHGIALLLNVQGRERAQGARQAKPSLIEQLAWAFLPSQTQLAQAQAKNKLHSPKTVSLPSLEGCLFSLCVKGLRQLFGTSDRSHITAAFSSGSHSGLLLSCQANACTALQLTKKTSCLLQPFPSILLVPHITLPKREGKSFS